MDPRAKHLIDEAVGDGCLLFSCDRGSKAHGMYVPSNDPNSIDDIDYFGLVVAPRSHYFGLTPWGSSETKEIFEGDYDILLYEFRKFVKLLLVCNPNVLCFLYMPEYITMNPYSSMLFESRDEFLSSKAVYKSFVGYGTAQLTKAIDKTGYRGFRGEKRKELREKFGYDTKHASHCVRLLRMGEELLVHGELFIDRRGIDADELLDIKQGKWTLDEVKAEAYGALDRLKDFDLSKSPLPGEPNKKRVEEITILTLSEFFED